MIDIIIQNFGFWFNVIIPVVFSLYLVFTNREYIWKEFGIQFGVSLIYALSMYAILFASTTDLMDKEYWNSKVSKFEYYESWTELVHYTEEICSGSGNNRHCKTISKTRHDYHPPYWQLSTTNGETLNIDKKQFLQAANEFGSDEKKLHRSDQVSWGDGNMFISIPTKNIPVSISHSYTNYVTAAKNNVIHTKDLQENIDILIKSGKLKPYPSEYEGIYGEKKLDRIIDTVGINTGNLINELDLASIEIGAKKQANPIIYITDLDRSFKNSLEFYWNKAKKNDIILVLGIDKFGKIEWSDVITWTNNTDFIVDCGINFQNLEVSTILPVFTKLIHDEYIRKPMKEFEYLKENITLEWYWQFIIILGNLILSFFTTKYFLENYERKNK